MSETHTVKAIQGTGRQAAPCLSQELADFVRSLKAGFSGYRPELHYMRGPGPKWHAKHGASTQPFSN